MQLRIPGPTPLPPESRKAAGRQMINHRGKEFSELLFRLTRKFQRIFQTKNDVLFLTSSGTGGMEAAIANLFSPGDKVVAFSTGYFGDRFAEIAERYGLRVAKVRIPDGQSVPPATVRKILKKNRTAKAVLITHNETSTGATNTLAKIAPIVKHAKKLLIVDAISSLAAIPLKVDRWGVDVAIAASQKATMAPPGIAIVTMSSAAWEAHKKARLPRYYWDFSLAKKFAEKGHTPATPALSTLFSLDVSTDAILKKGLQKTFQFHEALAENFRRALIKAGFQLLARNHNASATVTAAMLPEGLQDKTGEFIKLVKARFGVEVAAGQGNLKGRIFRVAHMGYVTRRELGEAVRALTAAKRALY